MSGHGHRPDALSQFLQDPCEVDLHFAGEERNNLRAQGHVWQDLNLTLLLSNSTIQVYYRKTRLDFSSALVFEPLDSRKSVCFLSMSPGASPKCGIWSVLENTYRIELKNKVLHPRPSCLPCSPGLPQLKAGVAGAVCTTAVALQDQLIPPVPSSAGTRQLTAEFLPGNYAQLKEAAFPEAPAQACGQPAPSSRAVQDTEPVPHLLEQLCRTLLAWSSPWDGLKSLLRLSQPCLTHLSQELLRAISGKAPARQSQPLPACFPGDLTSVGTLRGWL